jgi:flagellar protein FlbT
MSLRVELKDQERIIIGECVVINISGGRTELAIQGTAPVLRERDIMVPEAANTVAKRVYLLVQTMYLSRTPTDHHPAYFALVKDMVIAAPSTAPFIDDINDQILAGSMYKALKAAKSLIRHEQKLLAAVSPNPPSTEPSGTASQP